MTEHNEMEAEEQARKEQTVVNQCSSCGGNTHFDPEQGSLVCPFCGSTEEIEVTRENTIEHDFLQALNEEESSWDDEKRVFSCDNCGGESVLDKGIVADFCGFCGSSHIVKTDEHAGIKPALVIPFQIPKDAAVTIFKQWIQKKFFAPTKLKHAYELQTFSGIYVPYWTFDSHTYSSYVVQIGTYYYVTVTDTVYEDGKPKQVTRQERRIRWHTESGTYKNFFDDVLVHASTRSGNGRMRSIEPYHLLKLVDYRQEYLSGFLAERYSVPLKDGWGRAKIDIDSQIEQAIQAKTYGDIVNITSVSTDYDAITYKHILLPVWLSSFRFHNKTYHFLINGQTGMISGKTPISITKVSAVIVTVIVTIVVIYFMIEGF